MVRLTRILTTLTVISATQACFKNCWLRDETPTTCSWECFWRCRWPNAEQSRDIMLSKMIEKGLDCVEDGTDPAMIKCMKSPKLGDCRGYFWICDWTNCPDWFEMPVEGDKPPIIEGGW